MKEIPFLPEQSESTTRWEQTQLVNDRLGALSVLARRLVQGGWTLQLTVRGVAFGPPEKASDGEAPEVIEKHLCDLGLEQEVREETARTLADIGQAEDEYDDRCRYEELDRKMRSAQPICECCEEDTEEEMAELEQQHGRRSLVVLNDYERGLLHGKREALRWMQGEEWQDVQIQREKTRLEGLAETAMAVAKIQTFLDEAENEADDAED